jgi:transcriptional regulator with XRE-family HTH domain
MTSAVGNTETFGTLLRRYRERAALSQERLAEQAGLSEDAVSILERGKRSSPRPDTVALLAKALGSTPEERTTLAVVARRQAGTGTLSTPGPAVTEVPHAMPRWALQHAPLPVSLTEFIGRERELGAPAQSPHPLAHADRARRQW